MQQHIEDSTNIENVMVSTSHKLFTYQFTIVRDISQNLLIIRRIKFLYFT